MTKKSSLQAAGAAASMAALALASVSALALALALVLTPRAAQAGAESVRLGTQDRAPYGSYQADQRFDGIAVRVIECALKRMGQPYVLSVLPWARVQLMAQAGQLDGFFPASLESERKAWAQESVAIASQSWVWYLHADSKLDPLSPQFKQNAKVGAHFGSVRLRTLQQEHYQIVLTPQSDKALLQAFAAGRADAVLGGDLTMLDAVRELKLDPASFKTITVRDAPQHAFFNRSFLQQHPQFLEKFNAQIGPCRKALSR